MHPDSHTPPNSNISGGGGVLSLFSLLGTEEETLLPFPRDPTLSLENRHLVSVQPSGWQDQGSLHQAGLGRQD